MHYIYIGTLSFLLAKSVWKGLFLIGLNSELVYRTCIACAVPCTLLRYVGNISEKYSGGPPWPNPGSASEDNKFKSMCNYLSCLDWDADQVLGKILWLHDFINSKNAT